MPFTRGSPLAGVCWTWQDDDDDDDDDEPVTAWQTNHVPDCKGHVLLLQLSCTALHLLQLRLRVAGRLQ